MIEDFIRAAVQAKLDAAHGRAAVVRLRIPRTHPNLDKFMAVARQIASTETRAGGLVVKEGAPTMTPGEWARFLQALEELAGAECVQRVVTEIAFQSEQIVNEAREAAAPELVPLLGQAMQSDERTRIKDSNLREKVANLSEHLGGRHGV